MVVGDLVKFKFKYEPNINVYIRPGDLGIVKNKTMWYLEVMHLKSGATLILKTSEIEILEVQ